MEIMMTIMRILMINLCVL